MSRRVHISVREARNRYPAMRSFLDDIRPPIYDEVVVEEGGLLPKAVARSASRTSGKVTIGFRIVNNGVLIKVPDGKKVREITRSLNPTHVIQIETTNEARRVTRKGASKVIRAATVVIYRTDAAGSAS